MSRVKRPSPAIVVAILALVTALVTPSLAQVATSALSKKEKRVVRKLARVQANKRITKRAPKLSVGNSQRLAGNPASAYQGSILFATVNANGTRVLSKERGVLGVVKLGGNGTYDVYFNRDIRPCTYQATVADEVQAVENSQIAMQGQPASGQGLSNNGVFVQTADSAGALADRGFRLAVIC